ncbi:GMC oxidoreductase-domain-containing protein [Xylaria digitata]|nr:GMC oxidoreductase-domain-containing protein [Xylaria digitata]
MASLGPVEASPFGAHLQTDEEIIAVLRQQINPSNAHQCCTAAMLPRNFGGVVDSKWKVHGIQGLRVADTSYWPFQTSGAPTATMYASGEKLADVIKRDYNLTSL